jgi:hypothetical protein
VKLIEAFIVAQQEYGIYGDWKAIHLSGCYLGRGPYGSMYFAYGIKEGLISQSDRLETVVSDMALKYPYEVLDERWKVSRYDMNEPVERK